MKINYPSGLKADSDLPKLRESLINLFNDGSALLKTPGIDSFATGVGDCRGAIYWRDYLYHVSGSKLIRIKKDGTIEEIGVIDGVEKCDMTAGNVNITIVSKGGSGYTFDGVSLNKITDTDYISAIEADIIDGIVVYVPEDGSPVFYGEVGKPADIRPLSFFDAEILPDKNTGVIVNNNDLYIMGEDSIEVFRHSGSVDAPFIRVSGASVQTGYIAGKTLFSNTFLFLGKSRGGTYTFNAMGSGEAPVISNSAVEEILNEHYTPDELSQCVGSRLRWKNTDMAIFELKDHTFLFAGGGWPLLVSKIEEPDLIMPWTATRPVFAYGKYIVGDKKDGRIGKLSDSITEYDDPIPRQIETFARDERGAFFSIDDLEIDVITGDDDPEGKIGLSMSGDGREYGEFFYTGLGNIGQYKRRVAWNLPGGLGLYENYAGIRLRTISKVNYASEALYINAS